ncbi:MAG TPA: ABC transporter ATP-binding protein [Ignavibacteria bacterium]
MKDLLPLFPYLKRYKLKIFWGFSFVVISIFLGSLYPLVLGNAVDELTKQTSNHSFLYYGVVSVSLMLISGIFLFFTRQTLIVVSREIENDMRYDFFTHLQNLDKTFYNNTTTGDLMAHATNDINNVRNLIGPGIMYSIQTLFRTVITLIILFNIAADITLIALLPLPLISFLVYKVMKYMYSRSMKVQESFSNMTTKAQENFSGIRVIKSYVREKFEIEEFNRISQDYQKKNLSLARLQAYSFPMMFLLTGISIILVIYFGGLKYISGKLTLGNITEFIVYLGQLTWPMIAFGWIINLVQRAAPSMQRIMKIINTQPAIKDDNFTDKSITPDKIKGGIEFKDVSFMYPGTDKFVLKNINLKIPEASTLGIIGHTGEGKTTLVNLLPRIFDSTEGDIFIDGMDIKKIPLESLRKSIGIVPQESFLFSDSIERNITYSSDEIDDIDVLRAAEVSGLYKDVNLFPEKFKTILGERGITLSGGQKQRTAIARAVYLKPKILILDDSLSAVDTHTEEEVLSGLRKVMRERTSIIIAHRISTIQNADKIIVISDGCIAEEGTHQELLEKEGIYQSIYQKQLLEEEIEEL